MCNAYSAISTDKSGFYQPNAGRIDEFSVARMFEGTVFRFLTCNYCNLQAIFKLACGNSDTHGWITDPKESQLLRRSIGHLVQSLKAQYLPGFVGGGRFNAQFVGDANDLLDLVGVALGQYTFFQVEVIFQPDAGIAPHDQ